ncbi:MAG: hypothetical protein ABIR13_01825 [Polaromonas sp.]
MCHPDQFFDSALMRAMYSFLSLLAVFLLVAVFLKKQLNPVAEPAFSSAGQQTQAETLKMQQQLVKQSVEAYMNKARSVEENP